jgi:sulfonate transport system permease protein
MSAPPPFARWISPVLILAVWQLASSSGLLPASTLGSPHQIADTAWDLIRSGQLSDALLVSLRRVAIGVVIGVALAIVLGAIAGLSSWGDVLVDPPMQMVKAVPLYGIVPLFIIWFGIGEAPKVILIALGVLVPLYLSLSSALRDVPPGLKDVATTLRLSRWDRTRRLSLAVGWLVLIVSETINADRGIGFIINNARNFLQTDVVVVGLLTYAFLGVFTDFLVRLLERRALRWQGGVRR